MSLLSEGEVKLVQDSRAKPDIGLRTAALCHYIEHLEGVIARYEQALTDVGELLRKGTELTEQRRTPLAG